MANAYCLIKKRLKNIEKNVLTAFDDLDNPEDMALFEEYLIKNLALYFEKWEDFDSLLNIPSNYK